MTRFQRVYYCNVVDSQETFAQIPPGDHYTGTYPIISSTDRCTQGFVNSVPVQYKHTEVTVTNSQTWWFRGGLLNIVQLDLSGITTKASQQTGPLQTTHSPATVKPLGFSLTTFINMSVRWQLVWDNKHRCWARLTARQRWRHWLLKHDSFDLNFTTTTPQPFYGPCSGTTQVSWCQKRTSGLYGARED